jgi:squamous cell carcinoma antigen recognized by T-cells 3
MEETQAEFSAFVTKYNNDQYESIMTSTSKEYGKALKALREREVYELQLIQTNSSYEVYSAYLEWELSTSAKVQIPRLTQMLFERVLVTYWQQDELWQEYVYFGVLSLQGKELTFQIQKKFEKDEVLSILDRATRNCPWSGDLWGLYLRVLATTEDYPFEDLYAMKQKAISVPWLSGQTTQLAKLYLAWITICRTRIIEWDEQIEETAFLEEELDECLEKIGTGKTNYKLILTVLTAFEYPEGYMLGKLAVQIKTLASDPEQARETWEFMLKSNATRCDYWLDRMAWEKEQGNPSVCKEMFKKNLFKVVDDPIRFGYAYLSFLAENGTLDELNIGYSTMRKVFKKNVRTP